MHHKTARNILLGLLILLSAKVDAGGNNGASVTLTLQRCTDVSQEEVERILAVELRTIAEGRDDVKVHPTAVTATCDAARISLTVEGRQADERRDHAVPIDDPSPDGLERLIAIAAAELVFSSWVELADPNGESMDEAVESGSAETVAVSDNVQSPLGKKMFGNQEEDDDDKTGNGKAEKKAVQKSVREPDAQTPSPADEPSRAGAKKPKERRLSLGIAALWRMYVASGSHLFGGDFWMGLDIVGPLYVRMGAALEGGRSGREIGKVSTLAFSALVATGGRWTLADALDAGIEGGLRAGYGILRGVARDNTVLGEKVTAGVGGPLMGVMIASHTRPSIGLSFEAGYAAWGVSGRVAGDDPVELKGWWISLLLACGVHF